MEDNSSSSHDGSSHDGDVSQQSANNDTWSTNSNNTFVILNKYKSNILNNVNILNTKYVILK